jgi:two-component system, cell cycle sensor histidine kinase and response regulator CckA
MNLHDLIGKIKFTEKIEDALHLCLSSIETAKVPILWIDSHEKFILVNRETCRLLGYSQEELLSKYVSEIHPDYPKMRSEGLIDKLRDLGSLTLESSVQTKDGTNVPVELTINFLKLDQGEYVFIIARDLTERCLAAKAIDESEKYYQAIFQTTGAATMILEEDASISLVNKEFERLTGESKETILGRKWTDFICHPDGERMREFHRVRRKEPHLAPQRYETFFIDKWGNKRNILISVGMIPDTSKSVVSFLDITERKKAEETAQRLAREKEIISEIGRIIGSTLEMEEVYEKFAEEVKKLIHFDCLSIHICSPKRKTSFVAYANGVSVFGRNKGDLIPLVGSFDEILIHSRESLMVQGNRDEIGKRFPDLKTNLDTGLSSFMSIPLVSQGQVIGLLHFRSYTENAYREENRYIAENIGVQIAGAIANAELFSQSRTIAEALRESENKYRTLVENANDAIFIAQDGMIKFPTFRMPNPKFSHVTGYSPEELSEAPATTSFLQFIHPEDQKWVLERHLKRLRGEEVPSVYSFRLINKKGETVWVQINSVTTTWEGRPASLNFLRDISHEKKLERQFYTAQKMEAVGTLAAGIAHDFNNLLMGIQGYVSLILFDGNGNPLNGHQENLRRIEELVKSGSSLTGQLLGFARKGKFETKPSDVNQIIERTTDLFGRTRKEVNHHKRLQENIWAVEVDRGQIEQVFLNLFVNAWQAMPGGGDLYIESRNVILGDDYIKPYSVKKGSYVKVSITDTGLGMDKITRQRIFEPFFTTKEMGRGTGLGLATVYGIIKNHGGYINVYSEKGHGTTFTIYLPATEKEIGGEKIKSSPVLGGQETILLVDDEEVIISVIGKALKLTGYNPLTARGGKEAIEIYQKHSNQIALVILDMIMPGMSGGAAYDHLKEINPSIKVILSSGYSLDGEASQILEKGCNGFIQKPYGIQELSQKIREVLTP